MTFEEYTALKGGKAPIPQNKVSSTPTANQDEFSPEALDAFYGLTPPEPPKYTIGKELAKSGKRAALALPKMLAQTGAAASRAIAGPEAGLTKGLTKTAQYLEPSQEDLPTPEFQEEHPILNVGTSIVEGAAPILAGMAASRIPGVGPAIAKSVVPSFVGSRMYEGVKKQDELHPERSEQEKQLRAAGPAALEGALFAAMPKVESKVLSKFGPKTASDVVKSVDILGKGTAPSFIKETAKKAGFDTAYLMGQSKAIGGASVLADIDTPEEYAEGFTPKALLHEAATNLGMGIGFGAKHALQHQQQLGSLRKFATMQDAENPAAPAFRQKGYEGIANLLEQKGYKEEAKAFKANMMAYEAERAQNKEVGLEGIDANESLIIENYINDNLSLLTKPKVTNDKDETSLLETEGSLQHDIQNKQGLPSAFREWQKSKQTQPLEREGQEAIEASGDVQALEGGQEGSGITSAQIIPYLTDSKFITESYLAERPLLLADDIANLSPLAKRRVDEMVKSKWLEELDGNLYPTKKLNDRHESVLAQEQKKAEALAKQEAKKATKEAKKKGKKVEPKVEEKSTEEVPVVEETKVEKEAPTIEPKVEESTPTQEVTPTVESKPTVEEPTTIPKVQERKETIVPYMEQFGKKVGVYIGEGENKKLIHMTTSRRKAQEYINKHVAKDIDAQREAQKQLTVEKPTELAPTKERNFIQELQDLGYSKEEIVKLHPEDALDIIKNGVINPEAPTADYKPEINPTLKKAIEEQKKKEIPIKKNLPSNEVKEYKRYIKSKQKEVKEFITKFTAKPEPVEMGKEKVGRKWQTYSVVNGEKKYDKIFKTKGEADLYIKSKSTIKTPEKMPRLPKEANELVNLIGKIHLAQKEFLRDPNLASEIAEDIEASNKLITEVTQMRKDGTISTEKAVEMIKSLYPEIAEVPIPQEKKQKFTAKEKEEATREEPTKDEMIKRLERNLKTWEAEAKGRKLSKAEQEALGNARLQLAELKKTKIEDLGEAQEKLFSKASKGAAKDYERFQTSDKSVGASQSITKEVRGFVEDLTKAFNLSGKYFITSESDIQVSDLVKSDIAFGRIYGDKGEYVGVIIPDSKGNHIIALNDARIKDTAHLVNTLSHEVGHAIVMEHYSKAAEPIREAVTTDYMNWLGKLHKGDLEAVAEFYLDTKDKSIETLKKELGEHLTQGKIDINNDVKMQGLWHEYMAQQVAKYIRERHSKPQGAIDRFFKGLADQLRKLFNIFQANAIKNKMPVPSIQKWLDGLVESQRVTRRLEEISLTPEEQKRYLELRKKKSEVANKGILGDWSNTPEGIEFFNLSERYKEPSYADYALPGPKEKPFNLLIDASGEYKEKITGMREAANDMWPPNSGLPDTHFGKGNLAHIRGDIRTTTDGIKVLNIGEVQSDWDKQYVKSVNEKLKPEEIKRIKDKISELETDMVDVIREAKSFLKDKGYSLENLNYERLRLLLTTISGGRKAEASDIARAVEYKQLLDHFNLAIEENRQKLTAQTKEIAPPPIEGKYWMQHTIRQIIRYAKEKGYDTITFPSTPEQVAEIEGWGKLEYKLPNGTIVDKPPTSMPLGTYRIEAHGQDMTSIIDRMINKIPKELEALKAEYGGEIKQVEISKEKTKPIQGFSNLKQTFNKGEAHTLNAFKISPEMAKEAERFGPKFSRIQKISRLRDRELDGISEEGKRMGAEVGFFKLPTSITEKLGEAVKKFQERNWRQAIVDSLDSIKHIDQKAYMLARLSREQSGPVEALFLKGNLKVNKEGVYEVDANAATEGLTKTFMKTEGEQNRWFMWMAAQRAEKLLAEQKEALFTPEQIKEFKTWNQGQLPSGKDRAKVYEEVQKEYNRINKMILDIGIESGIINKEGMETWDLLTYVPFYRDMGEGKAPINLTKKGVVNLQVFKEMKGTSTKKLHSDLMANTILNWMHILQTASKNRAARELVKVAKEKNHLVDGEAAIQEIPFHTKNAAWYLENGQKKHFLIKDAQLAESLMSLSQLPVTGPWVKGLEKFKHWLTRGATASPAFKVRNMLRDSVTAMAIAETTLPGKGYGKYMKEGYNIIKQAGKNQDYLNMLASGGLMRFGSILEGQSSKHIQRLINRGVGRNRIITRAEHAADIWQAVKDGYDRLSDISEGTNRAALYKKLLEEKIAKGMSKDKAHLEASYEARDMLDFSSSGTLGAIRWLSSTTPFFNARIQGMDKLARSWKKNPARFNMMLATTALASIALMNYYKDDPDWQKREEWDRNNFWWFKIPGDKVAFRIPKPFELGAMGTMAERMWERFINQDTTDQELVKSMQAILDQSLGISVVPQAIRPLINVYANKDPFTDKPIVQMGQEKLEKSQQVSERTHQVSKLIGKGSEMIGYGPSPVQVDHLIRGYFGWLGAAIAGIGDATVRLAQLDSKTNQPVAYRLKDIPIVGGDINSFVETLPASGSKFVTNFYEDMREYEKAYLAYNDYLKNGDLEKAKAYYKDHKEEVTKFKQLSPVKRQFTEMNARIKQIRNHPTMSGDEKRRKIEEIRQQESKIAKNLAKK